MNRIAVCTTICAAASLVIIGSATLARGADQSGSRILFTSDWLFARFGSMPDGSTREEPAAVERPEINDNSWRRLDLPHDWGIEGPFRTDLPGTTGKLPWAGIGWYRKHFTISPSDRNNRLFIDFDGAMSHAKVWLNGRFLGEWPYGYASFRLEMTPFIRFDAENVLAVRLENPPNSSRWYPGGGIYRNVWLVRSSPVHVAHWGSYVSTPYVATDSAAIRVRTKIDNQSDEPVKVTVAVSIAEVGRGIAIGEAPEREINIAARGTGECETEAGLHAPKLWALRSPNLYSVKTSIRRGKVVVDTASTVIGIRKAEFSSEKGFMLNGRRVRINGVCNHHDLGVLGTAINASALARQIRILQEMGCNAIRTSHNPPAPELLDLCDRMGMLVLDEAFDCWKEGKTPNDYSTLFKEWHEKDIRALVRRDRNHPCVVAWSAGNEIREQGDGTLARELVEIFHSEDPTRPVTAACDNQRAGFDGFQDAVDIFGYNYKPSLYGKFHDANPSKPLFGSETASCISSHSEYFFPVSDDQAKGAVDSQVSSYDLSAPPWATIPDVEFAGQDKNPFVAGEFVWTGFDYLGEPTPYYDDTSSSRSSYFGIVDLCGFRKDRFYLYQARWRPDVPMVHVLPHWNWPDRVGKITPVHVYTSGDEAELFLNGHSLGRKKKGAFQYRLRWDDVTYQPGELKVIAYKDGRQWAEDGVTTTGLATKLELSADRTVINADGRDLSFITVKILDKNGLLVPDASDWVHFGLSGPGTIAAVGNGDPTDHSSFQGDRIRAFHGLCLAVIRSTRGSPGSLRLTAESQHCTSGESRIETRE